LARTAADRGRWTAFEDRVVVKLTEADRTACLSRGKKALYGILAPLVVGIAGLWLILVTTTGEGPSVGGRGTVLALVLFPAGLVAACLLNAWVLFASLRNRLSAFLLGSAVPAIGLDLAYAYLWQVGPFRS
jgi:hypothetical protein